MKVASSFVQRIKCRLNNFPVSGELLSDVNVRLQRGHRFRDRKARGKSRVLISKNVKDVQRLSAQLLSVVERHHAIRNPNYQFDGRQVRRARRGTGFRAGALTAGKRRPRRKWQMDWTHSNAEFRVLLPSEATPKTSYGLIAKN